MEKYKKSYKNNKFEILAPTWNETFALPDASYSISDIQDQFEYILKKHETVTGKPSIKFTFYFTNEILLKIKTGYYIELLMPETMKLLGCT